MHPRTTATMQPFSGAAATACHNRCRLLSHSTLSNPASHQPARTARYMAARQFLGGISIDRRELTLDLHVSTNMADAQRPDWQKSVTCCELQHPFGQVEGHALVFT